MLRVPAAGTIVCRQPVREWKQESRIIESPRRGRLFVCATPIGNLADVSARLRETLARVDLIAAEDTRHTGSLLAHLGLSRPLTSLHAHNEAQRAGVVLERLAAGADVALVSDAGTPLLSDPGADLVAAAADAGFEVVAIPGPSALVAALSVAGLPTGRFCFEGFLPTRAGERAQRLAGLAAEPRTLVFYEAPHRIREVLEALAAAFGPDRAAVVCRELTKLHETVYRGSLAMLVARAAAGDNVARGEITLVVAGAPAAAVDLQAVRRTVALLAAELPPARAAALAAQLTGCRRAEAYAIAQELKGERD